MKYKIWLAPHMALRFEDEPSQSFREGVDDVRYVSTLLAAIRKAKTDPAKKAAAVAAEKWLADIDPERDLDALRRQIVDKIIQLMHSHPSRGEKAAACDRESVWFS